MTTTKYKADTENGGITVGRSSVCGEKWKQNTLTTEAMGSDTTHSHIQHRISNSTHRYSLYWGFSQLSIPDDKKIDVFTLLHRFLCTQRHQHQRSGKEIEINQKRWNQQTFNTISNGYFCYSSSFYSRNTFSSVFWQMRGKKGVILEDEYSISDFCPRHDEFSQSDKWCRDSLRLWFLGMHL